MSSRRQSPATASDPAHSAAREIRRLSEALALARLAQVLDEADEWAGWLAAAVPPAPSLGPAELSTLRAASQGFEGWLDRTMGHLLALGSELVRRAEQVRFAVRACLEPPESGPADGDAGRRRLEASVLQLERALARARTAIDPG